MAIGSDGFPIMVHGDRLNVVHCDDIDCTATTSSTLLSGTSTVHPFITIGVDGLPVISFALSSHLALAHCVDLICSDAVLTLVDDWDKVGEYNSVTIGQDGLPIIAYYDEMFQDLKVAHCPDPITCGP